MVKTSRTSGPYLLGFDGGGTKSICVVTRSDGSVAGVGMSGCANFQANGIVAAGIEVGLAIENALVSAGISAEEVSCAAYGIAGADREADFDIVVDYVTPHNPGSLMLVANDTTIALRAGTEDGTGVALICGTGSNCIGFNDEGKQAKVGGLGRLTGDCGSGENIVERAIIAGMRAVDGRGRKTILESRLCEALGIKELVDVIAFSYVDDYNPPDLGKLAPIVFECAAEGDRVAISLLNQVGDELGDNALVACRRLFSKQEEFPVVLGGSILQNSHPPILVERIDNKLSRRFPHVKLRRLDIEPVLGAAAFALDLFHGNCGKTRMKRLVKSYKPFAVR